MHVCVFQAQTFVFNRPFTGKLSDFPTNLFYCALAGKPVSSPTIRKIVFIIRKIIFIIRKIIFPLI